MNILTRGVFLLLWCSAAFAATEFGEIDLAVRESIAAHFAEYHRGVDLNRLEYQGEIRSEDAQVLVFSSVWAQQGFDHGWGWHDCTTHLKKERPGVYRDMGSDCEYQRD